MYSRNKEEKSVLLKDLLKLYKTLSITIRLQYQNICLLIN